MKQLSQQQLKTISSNFQQGQRALQLGAFNLAEKHFLDVLKINPNVIEAQAALAFVYVASKQHAKATTQLKILLKAKPNHAQTHYNLANSLYEQQLYDEAIKHYEAALIIDPKLVETHIHCGIAYRMNKNYDAAIACLHRALDLDKANARAFHILGMVYVDIEDYNRALHCLESSVGLAPKHAEYRVSFASVLEKANLDFEAGLEYHQACEINPNYLDSFTLYGDYLLKGHRHDEALECMKHAEQLAPQNLDVLDKMGQIYLGMNDTDAATAQYIAALKTESKRVSSLLGLGQVYQELGNSAKGIEICDEIIAIDSNKPSGYLLKSRMKKSKFDDGLADQLIKFTNNDTIDDIKHHVHFALGKIYDDQNNFAEAFKHYSIGNSLKNKKFNYSAEADESRFSNLIETFNSQLFDDFKHLGVGSNLPVVIVGMPRSGTTLTEQIISSHPNVIGAGEVVFWGKAQTALPLRLGAETAYPECIKEINAEQAKDISAMYEATLRKIAGADTNPMHITDKMPHNFRNLGLIALLFPNVKIIHTKRDPIDTCLSIFFQNFNSAHDYASDLNNLSFHYKQYQRIMHHWHEVLPGRIMDINYEDTIADPEFWSRKLIDHIGLEWDDACLAPHKLERSVKTASHWQVRQPIYKTSVQRWKNYEEFLGPLIEALKD
jgi:tetratricopeptide (TPR) repeat protein